jgi:hypothetical protein
VIAKDAVERFSWHMEAGVGRCRRPRRASPFRAIAGVGMERRRVHTIELSEKSQQLPRAGGQRFGERQVRRRWPVRDRDGSAPRREQLRGGRARGPAADHENV